MSEAGWISPIQDGRHLLVRTKDESQVYDFVTDRIVHRLEQRPFFASFLRDQNTFATIGDSEIEYWDTVNWEKTHSVKLDESIGFGMLAPAGDAIVTRGSSSGQLEIWQRSDTGKWQRKVIRPHLRKISDLAFSPDGKYLATSSEDGTARIIDVATGQFIHHLRGHLKSVQSICFSPDGRRVATGGVNNDTVKIWDVTNGQEVVTLTADSMLIKSLSLSPDGNSIAAHSGFPDVHHVWHAPSLEQIEKQKLSQATRIDQASSKHLIA